MKKKSKLPEAKQGRWFAKDGVKCRVMVDGSVQKKERQRVLGKYRRDKTITNITMKHHIKRARELEHKANVTSGLNTLQVNELVNAKEEIRKRYGLTLFVFGVLVGIVVGVFAYILTT